MIEVRDLYKYYGDRRAVGPLSFDIAEGEIVGLLGLNGAGKTTTLRVLACDLLPSSGTVRVSGHDVVEAPGEVRKRIGYLPDTPPLYVDMTVRDYLVYAAELRGVTAAKAKERARIVAGQTQLDRVLDDPIHTLSHGYKQRVGIAQAIVHNPHLLVLDEPITGLDPVQIVEMRELLKGLRGSHTILLSSHILSEISETCDRILVMRQGEITAAGTERELSMHMLVDKAVQLTVRGERAQALETVKRVDGVANATATENGDGLLEMEITSTRDIREDAAKALIQGGFGLLAMQESRRELESLFLELTGRTEENRTSGIIRTKEGP